jgi:hypothetical protein
VNQAIQPIAALRLIYSLGENRMNNTTKTFLGIAITSEALGLLCFSVAWYFIYQYLANGNHPQRQEFRIGMGISFFYGIVPSIVALASTYFIRTALTKKTKYLLVVPLIVFILTIIVFESIS